MIDDSAAVAWAVLVLGFGSICETHRHHSAGFSFLDIARRFSPSNADASAENFRQFSPAALANQNPARPAPIQGCNILVSIASIIMPPRQENARGKGVFVHRPLPYVLLKEGSTP